ncbi:Uncharacterised protein [Myroides odoratus]|nr:hypothetical protein Myrod_3591 [Myroides odoratus DSM 2801]EKB03854.1 hypothetical protein HMPREF9716_03401 [Myroides odoratus CIP 103059]STZ31727.1 Uncharacterised protein [Myroides odoratus]
MFQKNIRLIICIIYALGVEGLFAFLGLLRPYDLFTILPLLVFKSPFPIIKN